ncbi:antitoxin [Streptomyces sp. DG2A-72]|uniref:antitoxin n=1 Tax=Streptomyces sp. DG2A-72 TaxID=3051386 RepID=UPI00265BAB00|nr:antitoxin [Streptomyces sp. DG2A-72]MDO0933765.1 antitoxin [Streptomyces sp. DG2A-72]
MGIFEKLRNQVKGDKAKDMSDTAEQKVNEKTGNKYESQVDQAQQRAEGAMGMDRDKPEQP